MILALLLNPLTDLSATPTHAAPGRTLAMTAVVAPRGSQIAPSMAIPDTGYHLAAATLTVNSTMDAVDANPGTPTVDVG